MVLHKPPKLEMALHGGTSAMHQGFLEYFVEVDTEYWPTFHLYPPPSHPPKKLQDWNRKHAGLNNLKSGGILLKLFFWTVLHISRGAKPAKLHACLDDNMHETSLLTPLSVLHLSPAPE